ncbi:MAG TPA: sigma factor, partial [Spirochaetota bacterium]|nr:sigma factor [Spirochaetota bacterium]
MFLKNREFAEAYNDLYPVVFGAVYSKVGNPEDAQDICQELFVKLYEKLETIENRRKWLYGALRLEVMAYYRKKKPDGVDIDEVFADVGLTFVNGFRDARIVISGAIEHDENFEDERERAL